MNTKSTQRFVGMVVAVVATVLLLMALPSKRVEPAHGDENETQAADEATLRDPREVLPVFELKDGWWVLTRYGMRMQLPEGWTPMERNDRPHAYLDTTQSGAGAINVLSLPNFYHTDLADLAEENRTALNESETLELLDINEFSIGAKQALRIDYRGSPAGVDMRFAAVVFLLGGHQVVVTASSDEEHWSTLAEALGESLATVELLDLPAFNVSVHDAVEPTESERGDAQH